MDRDSKARLTVRMACGFRSLDSLFAKVMLGCSGAAVPLLGRV